MARVDFKLETGLGGRKGTPAGVTKTDGDVRYHMHKSVKVCVSLKPVKRGILER
jgi:hypothetical protein